MMGTGFGAGSGCRWRGQFDYRRDLAGPVSRRKSARLRFWRHSRLLKQTDSPLRLPRNLRQFSLRYVDILRKSGSTNKEWIADPPSTEYRTSSTTSVPLPRAENLRSRFQKRQGPHIGSSTKRNGGLSGQRVNFHPVAFHSIHHTKHRLQRIFPIARFRRESVCERDKAKERSLGGRCHKFASEIEPNFGPPIATSTRHSMSNGICCKLQKTKKTVTRHSTQTNGACRRSSDGVATILLAPLREARSTGNRLVR